MNPIEEIKNNITVYSIIEVFSIDNKYYNGLNADDKKLVDTILEKTNKDNYKEVIEAVFENNYTRVDNISVLLKKIVSTANLKYNDIAKLDLNEKTVMNIVYCCFDNKTYQKCVNDYYVSRWDEFISLYDDMDGEDRAKIRTGLSTKNINEICSILIDYSSDYLISISALLDNELIKEFLKNKNIDILLPGIIKEHNNKSFYSTRYYHKDSASYQGRLQEMFKIINFKSENAYHKKAIKSLILFLIDEIAVYRNKESGMKDVQVQFINTCFNSADESIQQYIKNTVNSYCKKSSLNEKDLAYLEKIKLSMSLIESGQYNTKNSNFKL